MAIVINGRTANTLAEAINICREEWAAAKAPAVAEQRAYALSKPTLLDRQRAEAGVLPDLSRGA